MRPDSRARPEPLTSVKTIQYDSVDPFGIFEGLVPFGAWGFKSPLRHETVKPKQSGGCEHPQGRPSICS
jgi:hypothetical protein